MKRRLSFAAPFVMVAACHHGPSYTHNPPEPARHYAEWNVSKGDDGTCSAEDAMPQDCPPDMDCNPPAPMKIACPDGITADASLKVYQETDDKGPCFVDGATPTKVDCPTDE